MFARKKSERVAGLYDFAIAEALHADLIHGRSHGATALSAVVHFVSHIARCARECSTHAVQEIARGEAKRYSGRW